MCEAVPGAALDAQPILRIARRVDSVRVRVEPDALRRRFVDDDVRAGRCPRPRVAVDKARDAVHALEATDGRTAGAACAKDGHPRDTHPVGTRSVCLTKYPEI